MRLRKGDRIHISSGVPSYFGIVTEDQRDDVVEFAADGDDPAALDYGRRTAWRWEVSLVRQPEPLNTPLLDDDLIERIERRHDF